MEQQLADLQARLAQMEQANTALQQQATAAQQAAAQAQQTAANVQAAANAAAQQLQQQPPPPPNQYQPQHQQQYAPNMGSTLPKLKNFKVPRFDGKELSPGLGHNFVVWHRMFVDAIAKDVAFYGSAWQPIHLYHALKDSLSDGAATTVAENEENWRQQIGSNYGYEGLLAKLKQTYTCHLTASQFLEKMKQDKRWQHTWAEHAQYLRHLQGMSNSSNGLTLDYFCRYSCPAQSQVLLAKIDHQRTEDPSQLDEMVVCLNR